MSKVACFFHGIYPRSGQLAQASRDFDRKRLAIKDLKVKQLADFSALIALQKSGSFDYIEDGKLSWQDIFRPIVEATNGMEVGALTRWFDNNSFFRQPIIGNKINVDTKKLDNYFPVITPAKKWKVTLPSPFTFAKLASSKSHDSFEKRLGQTTEITALIIKYLEKRGVSYVQLNEPSIPYFGTTKKEITVFLKSLSVIKKARKNLKLAIHFYFGDATPIISALNKTDLVDVVGIDFYKTSLSQLPKNINLEVIAGIIDGRNSLMESGSSLKQSVSQIIERLNPPVLYLSNNSDLEFLPEPVAKEKLSLLGELTRSFRSHSL